MRLLLVTFLVEAAFAWGEKDRVRLEDVEVITLTRGAWTNGRYYWRTIFLNLDLNLLQEEQPCAPAYLCGWQRKVGL